MSIRKTLLAGFAALAFGFPTSLYAVSLNGLDWRQLTDTAGLSWNQIASVCNGVDNACSGSVAALVCLEFARCFGPLGH